MISITAVLLIGAQYYYSQQIATDAAYKDFHQIFQKLDKHNRELAHSSKSLLELLETHPDLTAPVLHSATHPALKLIINALQNHGKAYAIYIGHENGDFYEVINMQYDSVIPEKLRAPPKSRWGIIKLSGQDQHQTKRYQFLDSDFKLIGSRIEKTTYQPSVRPWYQLAMKSKGVQRTDPYMFSHLQSPGITYAKHIKGTQSVIALDYTSLYLSHMMGRLKPTLDSDIFLFNATGKKLVESKRSYIKPIEHNSVAPKTSFSTEEQAFIQQKTPITLSNQQNWMPFDFVENGLSKGYSIDIMKLISSKSGLNFEYTNGYSWSDMLRIFQSGDLDIIHSIAYSEEHANYGLFTDSFHEIEYFFISHKDSPTIPNYEALQGKYLAMVKGSELDGFIQQNYPEIVLKHYPNASAAIQAVDQGQAYAVLDTQETFLLHVSQQGLKNISLNNLTPKIAGHNPQKLFIMVQPDQPVLADIINKTLAQISTEEKQQLMQKWHIGPYATQLDIAKKDALFNQLREKLITDQQNQVLKLKYEDKTYLAMFSQFNIEGKETQYLGAIAPFDTLLEPYMDKITISIFLAFIISLLILPLAYLSTVLITRPINEIMAINKKIKLRRYDEIEPVSTVILELQNLSDSMADLAHKVQKHQMEQEKLFDSIIKLIAEAIDVKSPYTGGHCLRMPELAIMLLQHANADQSDPFKRFSMTNKDDIKSFEIGAWLHDCGKITTPDYVVDKATKLQTINNRIHEIRTRFEVLWRDAEITYLQALLQGEDQAHAKQQLEQSQQRLQQEFEFIAKANIGGEFMDKEQQDRIHKIGSQSWQRHFDKHLGLSEEEKNNLPQGSESLPVTENLLSDKPEHLIPRHQFDADDYQKHQFKTPVPEYMYNLGEITNLCIERGTLTEEERFKIKEHVMMTIRLLEKLPFPEHLTKVPSYAGAHHETLIGNGYPRQLSAANLTMPQRIMVIADIFEALTASDRPYHPTKTLSESLKIMSFMRHDQHIDGDLFELFLRSGAYLEYANKHMLKEQIDTINIDDYLH